MVRITFPGRLAMHRTLVTEELPRLVWQSQMDAVLGGKFIREKLGGDRFDHWKVMVDAPTSVETYVNLGKVSRDWVPGRRFISVKASEVGEQTLIELSSKNSAGTPIMLGLLLCVVPGLVLLVIKSLNDSHERKAMEKAGTKMKEAHPEATLELSAGPMF